MTHSSQKTNAASSDPSGNQRAGGPRGRKAKATTMGGAGIAVLLALYAFAQPLLNERFGWQLPELTQAAQQDAAEPAPAPQVDTVDEGLRPPGTAPVKRFPSGPLAKVPAEREAQNRSAPATADSSKLNHSPSGEDTSPTGVNQRDSGRTKPQPADAGAANELLYGLLVDQGGERYVSPAGLLYTRGSQEGHRLRHLERHVVDDPDRPGSHGVFDGGMAGALRTVDRAYTKAKTGVQTSTLQEDGRTIHTVDLATRVGYVGGSEGRRRKNPMARRVRLVLERNRVITAYPM